MTGEAGEAGQEEVIRFLSDPATHGGAAVERVDTHISRLFLAGDRAWKLKRAIRANYLDFSTLDRRERSCRREIAVNRAAGDLYLGVVPVTREAEGLALGGPGAPVEWLVAMRRFDRSLELDRLCDAGRLTLPMVERLADEVAALHRAAPPAPGFGDIGDLRARIDQIAGALAGAGPGWRDAAGEWRGAARAALEPLAGLVARRRWLGRTRRCHGDLHLGNVVLLGERPVPFDAIEFDEAIASIDLLYDLALTLADLLTRGRRDLANALLSRYLGATRDHGGLPPLPLFLSMRGAVRAMAAASRGAAEEAERDLAFAARGLRQRAAPRLVALGGVSGSGKSTLARALAPRLAPLAGAVVIRSDVTRKRMMGARPEDRLPPAAYGPEADRKVLARIAWDARAALRAGTAVVLDATFLDPEARACLAAHARAEGVPFDGIWLDLPAAEAAARVERRTADASDATGEVVARQAARADPPAGWRVIAAGRPAGEVAAEAARILGAREG
ncbi:AAA family ATPase [Amaricoccus solimangrovi]|uniref:bifunctional aminoglycoside phosphotransferase/ATP-binding protein n=1 Tax=Amaricoccus solimangrovi TaxID=2589815 RepID=UPI001F2DEC52|nr:bifunctional aminoglycoside phosphotransferase/ATP-binding protein [Amaricoccus solimangrovi]